MIVRRVVFVGSQSLALDVAHAVAIFEEINALPEGTSVLLRRGIKTGYGPFEQLVAEICDKLTIPVEAVEPEPGKGRAAVFERDIAMAQKADEVVAFFPPDDIMGGGTGHVVEKAIDVDRRVNCYIIQDGRKQWVAGHEPEVETVGVYSGE